MAGDYDGSILALEQYVEKRKDVLEIELSKHYNGGYYYWFLHRIVADGDARVRLTLGRTDVTALRHISLGHLVAQHVSRSQLVVCLISLCVTQASMVV